MTPAPKCSTCGEEIVVPEWPHVFESTEGYELERFCRGCCPRCAPAEPAEPAGAVAWIGATLAAGAVLSGLLALGATGGGNPPGPLCAPAGAVPYCPSYETTTTSSTTSTTTTTTTTEPPVPVAEVAPAVEVAAVPRFTG